MKPYYRALLIVVGLLVVLTATGLVLTSDWGNRAVLGVKSEAKIAASPVNMQQFQTALNLAALAATPEEQAHGRDAIRMADHEVDFAFTAALYQAASQPVPSTPEIKSILGRVSTAQKRVDETTGEVSRLTKSVAESRGSEKDALTRQLDLANARRELNQDELADAQEDLERAGGDPKSRIQRMVDEHKAADQNGGGQLDLNGVGRQAATTLPASNSFFSRAQSWFALRSVVRSLTQAEQEATAAAAAFSTRHDELERQIEEKQSQQSKKLSDSSSAVQSGNTSKQHASAGSSATSGHTSNQASNQALNQASSQASNPVSGQASDQASDQTDDAISTYRSLGTMQKRMSNMDSRIRNQQELAANYTQWISLASARERSLLHGLLVSIAWMLVIAVAVLIADRLLVHVFDRLEPDRKNLLTIRTVAHFAARAIGLILILFVMFGLPTQMATVIALAGAGLTVVMKDFIVGFFGWFVLMGKNGIRHGDWVEINGVTGEVVEIGLFHTVLLETGNWNDSGHPTGRRVTFVNSYAIEGHYFNFSTSGQWLWDELEVVLPADKDPYPVVSEIQKLLTKETEANARQAEQEWKKLGDRGIKEFSAGPAIGIRPANPGFEVRIRYVTRANERFQQKSRLYQEMVELLRQKNVPEAAIQQEPATSAVPSASLTPTHS